MSDIPILTHQLEFVESTATHTGLVAGFGAGKSMAGTMKTVEKKKLYPGVNVAYYLPTYSLIKDIAFPNFQNYLKKQHIPFELNKGDKEFITPLGKIILRSMDNPATIIGYEVGYSLIDEADILSITKMTEAFVKIVARNRVPLPDGTANPIDLVSTPEGFNFMYKFFVKENKPNRVLIRAKSKDNPYLPPSYFETLEDIYTEEQLQAYLDGEFVNLTTGTVYHKFERNRNHSDRTIKPREILHVGMDFNITKMSAVAHVTDGPKITAVAEVTGAYDTADMITILKERFTGHKIVVYPDASGQNRKTSASDTDIGLLKKAGFTVKVDRTNPSVRSRITAVNAGFLNAKGTSEYYVNTNDCPVYTEALEKLPYKNGVPDKDSGFDHVTDGGGYCYFQMKKTKFVRLNANQ